jgi:hypothetical protein
MNAANDRSSLPLPDYDHLPLGSLISRIRSLATGDLDRVLEYEREHADRLPVIEALQARRGELDAGAELTHGSASGIVPEAAPPPANPRSVDQTTQPPSINPPSHGDPTNPGQPR